MNPKDNACYEQVPRDLLISDGKSEGLDGKAVFDIRDSQ